MLKALRDCHPVMPTLGELAIATHIPQRELLTVMDNLEAENAVEQHHTSGAKWCRYKLLIED